MTGDSDVAYGGHMTGRRADAGGQPDDWRPEAFRGGRGAWIGLVFAAVWLVFLVAPLTDAWSRYPQPGMRALSTALMTGFVAIYLVAVGAPFRGRHGRWQWVLPSSMLVLALALLPLAGESGLNLLIFVSVAAHATLPMWRAVAVTLALVALSIVLLVLAHWDDDGGYPLAILAASMAMFGVVRMAERNRAMAASALEQARVAVLEERERIGRDLHDILGHSLTVIAVKSELAGRLIDRDPARARAEVADVERLARDALADVRSTAAGVRDVTLAVELCVARNALLAAGIEPDLPNAVEHVPRNVREVFGYVVREAVTNVIRHSRATRCVVRVTSESIEVVDDGVGRTARGPSTGHGLDGLRERVDAAGLELEAGPVPGGFLVAAHRPGRVASPVPVDVPSAAQAGPAPAVTAQG